ncbi:MAG TPA: ABC transporter permease [Puia sp.]|jgi:putative ABC transport system permease protein
MIRNYLKLAFRHLLRKKVFSFINLFGLTVGLVSCILIGLYITDELSFDKFHTKADRIVRVTMDYQKGNAGTPRQLASTGLRPGPRFQQVFPVVEAFARVIPSPSLVSYGENHFSEDNILCVDSTFLRIFSFPVLHGDPNSLNSKENIVVSASAAKKYFGTTDAVGKVLRLNDTKNYNVSAVVADPPGNSQLKFDFLISFRNVTDGRTESWWTANYITYLLLKSSGQIALLQQQIGDYMKKPEIRKEAGLEANDYLTFHLEPLKQVHLHSSLQGIEPNGNIVYVYVLAVIAILILVIACFNYTNLAIAQSANRTGEIGIRKVLGAGKSQLFAQFTGESLLITFLALVLAVVISIQLLPVYNNMTGKHLVAGDVLQIRTLGAILLTGLVIGLLAGSYPALVLANTRLIQILKSGFRITGGNAGLRKTLIVAQFVISLFLIITTVVILQQMNYIRKKDLGLDRDHVVVLPISYKILNRYDLLKKSISAIPGVQNASGSYHLPITATWGDGISASTEHGPISFSITCIPADLNYLSTMDMRLVAGSDFTQADLPANTAAPTDTTTPRYRFILNETAVKQLGWTPQEALGKIVSKGEDPGIIKGVVKDFNFASMHQAIGPLMLFADTQWVRHMLVRINGAGMSSTIARMEATWNKLIPGRSFDYHFLDDDYNRLYTAEQRTAGIFTVFSSLAIFLALLGLFGLAAITTIQRTKEIGIRKVLGANLLNISMLIARNFVVLVGISILIAAPLAWLASAKWLEGFAYRVQLQYWIFLAAGAGVIAIAFATVSYHAIKAGRLNPVESLKTE